MIDHDTKNASSDSRGTGVLPESIDWGVGNDVLPQNLDLAVNKALKSLEKMDFNGFFIISDASSCTMHEKIWQATREPKGKKTFFVRNELLCPV